MVKEEKKKKKFRRNAKLMKQKKKFLPIFNARKKLLHHIKNNETLIIMGETGSGKTTQIPQYIMEENLNQNGMICVTQPRRVAAISIAKRVAEETNTRLGSTVGYSVRFEDCCTPTTKIKFATDGMIIREALRDPLMLNYEWILLDEAHERSVNTDVLFGIVKNAQRQRKQQNKSFLKIIVMSATMNVDKLSQFFNDAFIVLVEGREHPIKTFFQVSQNSDYFYESLCAVWKINKEYPPKEDILLFLTGQEEIDRAVQILQQLTKLPSSSMFPTLKVLPLYSVLSTQLQNKIFDCTDSNERKVIVSTNIAETSITIPGIKYVVDSGRAKVREYNPRSGLETLQVRKISKAQAQQRQGRAGRNGPGACYFVFTEEEYELMREEPTPEILRLNLCTVILQLLGIGIEDVLKFDFIDRPPEHHITAAYTKLQTLGAIEMKDNLPVLTPLGRDMTLFPLDPVYSKVLLSSRKFGCTDEVISIISVLSSETIFSNPSHKLELANQVRSKFTSTDGDHLTLLNIFNAFLIANKSMSWCKENFLHHRNLYYATEVKKQLQVMCSKIDMDMVSCKGNTEQVLRCLLTGFYTNIAENIRGRDYLAMENHKPVHIHPASSLFNKGCPHVMYSQLVQTSKSYIKVNSKINAEWIKEMYPDYFIKRKFIIREISNV